jgi:hypothetical protein
MDGLGPYSLHFFGSFVVFTELLESIENEKKSHCYHQEGRIQSN